MRKSHTRGTTVVAVVALLTAGVFTVATGGAASAQTDGRDDREPRAITVQATGLVRGTPDVLELMLGVDTRGKTAGEALAQNNRLTVGVLKVLDDAGVGDKDIQTSNLSINPVYDDDGEVVIAYEVSNHVVATLRDLSKAGDVVDAATKAAGDEIVVQGLYFSIDDNSGLVAQARADAVKRAKTQAQQLADAAGVKLGDLQSLVEESSPVGPVLEAQERAAAPSSGDAPVPIQPGSQQLSVNVTLVYSIS